MQTKTGSILKSVILKMEPLQPGNNQASEIVRVCEVCGVIWSEFSSDLLFREHYKKGLMAGSEEVVELELV